MALSQKRKFTFTWQIQNFSMCPQKFKEKLVSAVFMVRMLKNSEWQLALYPRGSETENTVSCFLYCKSLGRDLDDIQIGYTLLLFSNDMTKHVADEVNDHTFEKDKSWGYPDFISRDDILGDKEAYLPNDTLTIKCSMWISGSEEKETDLSSSEPKSEVLRTVPEYNTHECAQWDEGSVMTQIVVHSKKISWPISSFSSIDFNKRLTVLVPSVLTEVPSFFITFYKSSADQTANIEIRRDKTDLSKISFFKCRASVFYTPKGVDISAEDEHLFESDVEGAWKFPSFIKLSKLEEHKYFSRTCGTLHLLFEFSSSRLGNILHKEKVPLLQCGTFRNLSYPLEEFRLMYKDGDLSDVTIRIGDREFKVHKIILKARSPVFKAMFDNDMKEKETGIIDITDVDPDTLDKMLDFMYTNEAVDVQADDALKLYSTADKYEVLSLKYQCTCVLATGVSVSNVCQVLTLADRHNDEYLRGCAETFVYVNSVEIFKSQEWENLMQTNSALAAKVMFKMLTT